MRKITFTLLLLMFLPAVAGAQTYDTVMGQDGRLPGYHYTWWYDSCDAYLGPLTPLPVGDEFNGGILRQPYVQCTPGDTRQLFLWMKTEYVPHPSAITGIGVWTVDGTVWPQFDRIYGKPFGNAPRCPEYIYVFQMDENRQFVCVDSARWDTAAPKIQKVARVADTAAYPEYYYFFLHEVTLDKPIEVDSTFYLAGSLFNNRITAQDFFPAKPTFYVVAYPFPGGRDACPSSQSPLYDYQLSDGQHPAREPYYTAVHGLYFPKIDYARLRAVPADSAMGTASPDEARSKHTYQTITARPFRGYRFSHWNDGSTDNPRSIRLTRDTTFTAYFVNGQPCYANVFSDDENQGVVTGGGDYYVGDTVTIAAYPWTMYRFDRWDDGDTSNPRRFVITQDTFFTAHFVPGGTEGVAPAAPAVRFTLSPNPAREYVTLRLEGCDRATLTLLDAGGREVLTQRVKAPEARVSTRRLPAGTYFALLATPSGSCAQKLVIE